MAIFYNDQITKGGVAIKLILTIGYVWYAYCISLLCIGGLTLPYAENEVSWDATSDFKVSEAIIFAAFGISFLFILVAIVFYVITSYYNILPENIEIYSDRLFGKFGLVIWASVYNILTGTFEAGIKGSSIISGRDLTYKIITYKSIVFLLLLIFILFKQLVYLILKRESKIVDGILFILYYWMMYLSKTSVFEYNWFTWLNLRVEIFSAVVALLFARKIGKTVDISGE